MSRPYHYAPTKSVIKPQNQFIYAKNACCVQLRLVLRERVNHNCTEILRDLLWNLFGCSSPVAGGAFSSETSLFLFAEAGITLAVYFFFCSHLFALSPRSELLEQASVATVGDQS